MKDPNRLPFPRGSTEDFKRGWRACEEGKTATDNPNIPFSPSVPWEMDDWAEGFKLRADRGFRVDHIARSPSGAFLPKKG